MEEGDYEDRNPHTKHFENKVLSHRRETALQGALLLGKSGRRELGDNISRTLWVYLQPL